MHCIPFIILLRALTIDPFHQGRDSAAFVWHDRVHAHILAAAELPAGSGGHIGQVGRAAAVHYG